MSNKKQKRVTFNLDLFFDNYIENLVNVSQHQKKILDIFRDKEEELKEYLKQVNILEKTKNNYKMKDFEYIVSNMSLNLAEEFSNYDIELKNLLIKENVDKLKQVILGIKNSGYEFENLSIKFNNLSKMWNAFINSRPYLDKKAIFLVTLNNEMKELENDIKKIDIEDIGRIEEKISTIKLTIERTVNAIAEIEIIYNKYFFVGYEAIELKKKIEHFFKVKYKKMSLGEIAKFMMEIEKEKKEIEQENIIKTEPINVVYITEKESKKIYSYGLYINEVYINPSEINFKNPVYNFINQYIYLDNFPIKGIFEKDFLLNNIQISQNQLLAIKEFNEATMKYFLLEAVGGSFLLGLLYLLISSFSLTTFLSSILSLHLFFMWIFGKLKKKIDNKFNVPNAFYFIKINYFYIKEGTDGMKYEKIPELILSKFNDIFTKTTD